MEEKKHYCVGADESRLTTVEEVSSLEQQVG